MNNVIKLEGFNIPLMDFKLKELASSELPDYNILSATFWMDGEDFKGEEFKEHMYNYLSDQLSVVKVDGHYRVRDNKTNKLLPKKADNMDKAVQLLISYRSKLADKLFEDGTVTVEKDYLDQSVSPYVFKYNDEVNLQNAMESGFGVLEIKESGEQFMFLRGEPIDLLSSVTAYHALTYGAISKDAHLLVRGDTKFFMLSIGEKMFNKVMEALKLKE